MTRPIALILAGLGAALVLLPLGIGQPGYPMQLRADETSHYLLARSLAADGDALVDRFDLDRLFREMPSAGSPLVAAGSHDGWQTARWAVAPLYAVVVAPATALAGVHGAFAFNALCFVLALGLLGGRMSALGPWEDRSLAWVLAGAALLLSGAFVYVWWLNPASLHLLLVAAALRLGWQSPSGGPLRAGLRLGVAGACLGLCAVEVPWIAALLPALLLRQGRSPRRLATLVGGAVLGAASALLLTWLVLGHASPAGFAERAIFEVESPDVLPWTDADSATVGKNFAGLRAAEGWTTTLRRLALTLVDRRRGLLVLFPFAVLFGVLVLKRSTRRSRRPETAPRAPGTAPEPHDGLDRTALAVGLGLLVASRAFEPADALDLQRYGDPTLAAAWPAFFFLPAALPGALALLATCAVAGLLLLPTIFTPFLPPMPSGHAHHAERSALLARLPTGLEEVSEAAGYASYELDGESWRLWLPDHATKQIERSYAFLGGERVVAWLESPEPRAALNLDIRSFAPGNRVRIRSAAGGASFTFPGTEPPEATRVRVPLGADSGGDNGAGDNGAGDNGAGDHGAWHRIVGPDGPAWAARLVVSTSTGESPNWRTAIGDLFYTGLLVTVLGSDEHLERPVWDVEWAACGAPPTAGPGESLRVLARLRNTSQATWPVGGAVQVRLGVRWHHPQSGEVVDVAGRADFRRPVQPGEEVLTWVEADAPRRAGTWRLEIEPVYEFVGWFTDRVEEPDRAVCATEVEILPAG